ncbi:TIGR03790 family protein [Oleiharenicola lentus]|uniref:TIGR03790 family protein n=1 Tax=Oleiharenicola lentus TaxID=2508720 RepID=UPI003F67366F
MKRFIFALILMLSAGRVLAGDNLAARVVILANSRLPESMRLAEFYADKRQVPRANIIALPMPEGESITWREFIDQIYQPAQDELHARGWLSGTSSTLLDAFGRKRYGFTANKISYLVVCRGVPLRIFNDPVMLDEKRRATTAAHFYTNEASVDGELSLLARSNYDTLAMVQNPLLANDTPSIFDLEAVVKVSRLDGPTQESARNLVTSAIEAENIGLIGRYYVDIGGPHAHGDKWLEQTADVLGALGYDGVVDKAGGTFPLEARFDAPALYFGWYVGGVNGPFLSPELRFPPGAIALHIHSFSAVTVRSDSAAWVGPLVARGVAATVGNVFEPYLELTHRPNLLIKALAEGKNWGDALYYSLPALSWKCVAIGDPLYQPFKVSLEQQEKNQAKLPHYLSPYVTIRRANLLIKQDRLSEAIALLKAEVKKHPDFVLNLALAKALIAFGQPKEAVDTLAFVSFMPSIRPVEWPLMREVAALLAANDARPVALKIYVMLANAKPPSVEALKDLLIEARKVADAARDMKLSLEFARELNELSQPPPAPATPTPGSP